MNKLIALCSIVLSLHGCDPGGSTLIHRTHVGGTDTLYSKVVAHPGVARFECLSSASGQCHYTLFPRTCASTAGTATDPTGRCPSEPIERFAIANGNSRVVPGLPRFRLCVSAESGAPGPDCQTPEPIAARWRLRELVELATTP